MKIAIIQNVTINDHRAIYNDGIARRLVKKGHNVDLILQETKEKKQFDDSPYNLIEIKGGNYSIFGEITFMYNLFKVLFKSDYDIVHCKNPFSSVLVPILLKRLKIKNFKIIYDIRGLWVDFGVTARYFSGFLGYFLNKIDISAMNLSDSVISISEELKKELIKRGVKNRIIVTYGDGVDISLSDTIKSYNIKEKFKIGGKVVGYLGSISLSRDSDKIIEAFSRLKDGDIFLIMIGPVQKNEKQTLKNMVKKYELKNKVFFSGFLPHNTALSYIKSCDVVISYHEKDLPIYNVAVPIKILEYLALGKPIVVPDHKMYTNILTHGKDAYITERNPESFAEGILKVLNDEDLARKLSQNARKTAKKYDFEKISERVMEVYGDNFS